jgi:hypothetical protein
VESLPWVFRTKDLKAWWGSAHFNRPGGVEALGQNMLVLIGFAGIMVTHRVAGPIYKMRMNLKAVADGHLRVPTPLRKGDELVDFFEAYRSMVIALRGRQEEEIHRIEKAITALQAKAGPADLESLQALSRDMKAALDT